VTIEFRHLPLPMSIQAHKSHFAGTGAVRLGPIDEVVLFITPRLPGKTIEETADRGIALSFTVSDAQEMRECLESILQSIAARQQHTN